MDLGSFPRERKLADLIDVECNCRGFCHEQSIHEKFIGSVVTIDKPRAQADACQRHETIANYSARRVSGPGIVPA